MCKYDADLVLTVIVWEFPEDNGQNALEQFPFLQDQEIISNGPATYLGNGWREIKVDLGYLATRLTDYQENCLNSNIRITSYDVNPCRCEN